MARFSLFLLVSAATFLTTFTVFAEGPSPVTVELVSEDAIKSLSKSYQFMRNDFLRAGGQGRTYVVRMSDEDRKAYPDAANEVEGPYLAVDRLPPSAQAKGASLVTRDPKVLDQLKSVQRNGIPLFIHANDRGIDAQVFANDAFGRPLREVAFSRSKSKFSFSASPSMTEDVFVHELEHIQQLGPDHPLGRFLASIKTQISEKQERVIRRALTEILAYKAQYQALQKMKKEGASKLLNLVSDEGGLHHVERASFEKFYENRLVEMKASIGLYLRGISSNFRGLPDEVECKLIDQARDAIEGMGKIETELVEDAIVFSRCAGVNLTPAEAAQPSASKRRRTKE